MRRGLVIAVLLSALLGSGGPAWAQPAPGVEGPAWAPLRDWAEGLQWWWAALWAGEATETASAVKSQATDAPGDGDSSSGDPSVGTLDSGETCEPGFGGCSIDPDG